MKLLVSRHGETFWNVEERVCGLTDVSLTEKGIAQARMLAEKVKNRGIDIIISSPLKRAYTTAHIVADRIGVSVETDKRLIEQNYGQYEGIDCHDERFLNNKRNFAYKYPGGESMMDVAYRTYGLIEELKKNYSDKTILLVCHNGVVRVINTYFKDVTNEEFFHYTLENCGLEEYEV